MLGLFFTVERLVIYNETWVEIAGYPNYAVSNMGRVFNVQRERILKFREAIDGSLRVSLSKDGEVTDHYVHHLVAAAFFGGVSPGVQVIHANGDKTENTPENLRLKRRERRIPPRSRPWGDGEVENGRHWGRRVRIVETGETFLTVRDCANYIKGDYSTIYKCLEGQGRKTHRGHTFEYVNEVGENAA